MNVQEYLEREYREIREFRSLLTSESDRGCALFACAYLDKKLSDLLHRALAVDKNIDQELFQGNAPLATFSSRIKLAYYLGKLSKAEKHDLNLIKRIRNKFAHSAQPITFETPEINNRCKELSFSYHKRSGSGRQHFTASCLGLHAHLVTATLSCEAPETKPDNAPTEEKKDVHRRLLAKIQEVLFEL